MHTLTQAQELILAQAARLTAERVPLDDAMGRVLGDDVRAVADLPAWDNSAMDGYAVRCAACAPGALLPVRSYLPAGGQRVPRLEPGTAARILTGAMLPAGADCVVPQEHVDVTDDGIRLTVTPQPGQNIRRRGGDLHAGDTVLTAGTQLRPADITVLAALGLATVPVTRRPRVAILSTGDELSSPGTPLELGHVYDANTPALRAAVLDAGGAAIVLPRAEDDYQALCRRVGEGLAADVLVTSAGVSVGDRDMVRAALHDLGAAEVFWHVAIQPGHPAAFAVTDDCLVFSLPGNPVAAMLTFDVLVRPALRKMGGRRDPHPARFAAILSEDVAPRADRLTLRRVRLERQSTGQLLATSAGPQATGFISTLSAADGIALIPAGTETLPAGTTVDVQLWRDDTEFRRGDR